MLESNPLQSIMLVRRFVVSSVGIRIITTTTTTTTIIIIIIITITTSEY